MKIYDIITEDADAGSSMASNIAAVVAPLNGPEIIRRVKSKKKKSPQLEKVEVGVTKQ